MAKPSHAKPSHAKCQVVQKHTSVTRAQAHTVPGVACGLPCTRRPFCIKRMLAFECTVRSVPTQCLFLLATPGGLRKLASTNKALVAAANLCLKARQARPSKD